MKRFVYCAIISAIVCAGCYSTARHVANVRPELVKPDSGLKQKYRLSRIVLKKSNFSAFIVRGYADIDRRQRELDIEKQKPPFWTSIEEYMKWYDVHNGAMLLHQFKLQNNVEGYLKFRNDLEKSLRAMTPEQLRMTFERVMKIELEYKQSQIDRDRLARKKQLEKHLEEDKKSGSRGTHAADTELVFSHVRDALLKNYPSAFSEDDAAQPIAVVVDWATEYVPSPNYASIFSYWLWPEAAEQESIYYIWITEDVCGKSDEELFADYISYIIKVPKTQSAIPGFIGKGSAVRQSEVWETGILPHGLLPVPGESDWPKTRCFMRDGKDSLVSSPQETLNSRKCFKNLVFEPKVDGDVLAAAIMRAINRHCRRQEADTIVKGAIK